MSMDGVPRKEGVPRIDGSAENFNRWRNGMPKICGVPIMSKSGGPTTGVFIKCCVDKGVLIPTQPLIKKVKSFVPDN